MLVVPQEALPHLVAAARQGLSRQEATSARDEGEWPDEFDGNDAALLEMALHALEVAASNGSEQVALSGKPVWILTGLLPDYVRRRLCDLSDREYEALKSVYRQAPASHAGEFPTG
ncbi:MAG: hypothetical protein JF588_07250 [Caulobacterales bacterium]|nr:hypothetical protein [Caulobacterales bacterium]